MSSRLQGSDHHKSDRNFINVNPSFHGWNGHPMTYPMLAPILKELRARYPRVINYLDGTSSQPSQLTISNLSAAPGSASVSDSTLPPPSNIPDEGAVNETIDEEQKEDTSVPQVLDISQVMAGRSITDQDLLVRCLSFNSNSSEILNKLHGLATLVFDYILTPSHLKSLCYLEKHTGPR